MAQRALTRSRPASVAPAPLSTQTMDEARQILTAAGLSPEVVDTVSGNAMVASAAVFKSKRKADPSSDRHIIAQPWQIEAYRHVKICGEARYAATLFASMAGRAEIGVSQPQTKRNQPEWVLTGPEVDAFAEIAPTVRERTRLIRDFMLHRTIAGECYLIARKRQDTDPGYVAPPMNPDTRRPYADWDDYLRDQIEDADVLDADYDPTLAPEGNPNRENPIWEIVGVTELRRIGGEYEVWSVRMDNDEWVELDGDDPVLRLWTPDPEKRREAWSPFQAMLPTLREIEWLTLHIFTQVRSRLMSAGVWFLPNNLTFAKPPSESLPGGEKEMATLNEAEQFMISLASTSMNLLDGDDVSMPSVIMADPDALAAIDQSKLIKFWSEIDDKAMVLRSDAIRRFALGMEMPPEQTLGSSGLAVSNSGGSAGSVNHWGEWAKEEQTISDHVEPALDDLVGVLTAVIRTAVEGTTLVIAYSTATMRMRQDRSEIALQLYDRGVISKVKLLEYCGMDPETDQMDDKERKDWLLVKIVSGQFAPEQMTVAAAMLGITLPAPVSGNEGAPKQRPGTGEPPNTDGLPYQGPPRGDHDHNPAPYTAQEVLVMRAMEKFGNRLLNDGRRGRDRDRDTPPMEAHLTASLGRTVAWSELDFSLAEEIGMSKEQIAKMARFTASLYNEGQPYTREALVETLGAS